MTEFTVIASLLILALLAMAFICPPNMREQRGLTIYKHRVTVRARLRSVGNMAVLMGSVTGFVILIAFLTSILTGA